MSGENCFGGRETEDSALEVGTILLPPDGESDSLGLFQIAEARTEGEGVESGESEEGEDETNEDGGYVDPEPRQYPAAMEPPYWKIACQHCDWYILVPQHEDNHFSELDDHLVHAHPSLAFQAPTPSERRLLPGTPHSLSGRCRTAIPSHCIPIQSRGQPSASQLLAAF